MLEVARSVDGKFSVFEIVVSGQVRGTVGRLVGARV